MLSWWRHSAPEGAAMRIVAVEDDGELIGLAPYYSEPAGRHDYRLMASGLAQRIEPLAVPGREDDVAAEVAAALKASDPKPVLVSLEGVPASSPWPGLLKRGLRAASFTTSIQDAPIVTLAGDFDTWMGTKSSNFRSQMKRARKKIEKAGGAIRMSTPETVEADIASFLRLHEGRWEGRGESGILLRGMDAMLRDAAAELLESGRFRLSMVDLDGKTISAQLFVAAGGELSYWNGGFDEDYAQYKPAMVAIFAAIEDAFERGDARLDLGGGAQDYKLRFADTMDPLRWGGLIPRGPRWPLVRAQMLPEVVRGVVLRSMSKERQEKLKKLLRRG
jgi:CelD/BcsL family acetyltransferase involved in cellulose biosynthesis